MLDLRHIRHFLAAASHPTVQEAADSVFITQPALTKSIARFEEEVGEKLFDRRGRRLLLTDFGQRLVLRCQDLLHHVDEVEEEVDLWKGIGIGEVAIGVDAEVELSLLPPVLEAFVPSHPGVRITVRSGHTETLLPALLAGELHFLVSDSEVALEHHELEIRMLRADPVAAALRPDHPMAEQQLITPDELMANPIAGAFTAPRYERAMNERRRLEGIEPLSPSLISDNYEVLVRLAETSDTIVIGPRSLLENYAAAGRVRVMGWPLDGPDTSPSLIFSTSRHMSPAVQKLISLFEAYQQGSEPDGASSPDD